LSGAISHEDLGDVSTAKGLTVPAGANSAVITVADVAIRFTMDAGTTTPTATVGLRAPVGSVIELSGRNELAGFTCIQEGVAADVHVAYFASRHPQGGLT